MHGQNSWIISWKITRLTFSHRVTPGISQFENMDSTHLKWSSKPSNAAPLNCFGPQYKHCGVRHLQTADLQTCRPADLQTCRLADLQTCRLADLQTCRLADLQTCRLADLQTCRLLWRRQTMWHWMTRFCHAQNVMDLSAKMDRSGELNFCAVFFLKCLLGLNC